jgi:hypothetical protein
VTINAPASTPSSATVNVSLLVNATQQQSMELSQTGLTFTAVANGAKPQSQPVAVFNLG